VANILSEVFPLSTCPSTPTLMLKTFLKSLTGAASLLMMEPQTRAADAKLCCVYVCMHDAYESLLRRGRMRAKADMRRGKKRSDGGGKKKERDGSQGLPQGQRQQRVRARVDTEGDSKGEDGVGEQGRVEVAQGEDGRGPRLFMQIEPWYLGPVPTYRVNKHEDRRERGRVRTEVERKGNGG
jgi:hypothetical protein